jgi:hypothetical protein
VPVPDGDDTCIDCPETEDAGCTNCNPDDPEPPEATFQVGFGVDSFEALRDGSELPVIFGFQGGTWTMPRVRALDPENPVAATFEISSGGELVASSTEDELLWNDSSTLERETPTLSIQVIPPSGDIYDLFGQQAIFSATFTTPGAVESWDLQVTLVEGN